MLINFNRENREKLGSNGKVARKGVVGFALFLTLTLLLTGCNKSMFDSKYGFDQALIFGDDFAIILDVKNWKDYSGEQIQIKIVGGPTMVTAAYDTILLNDVDSKTFKELMELGAVKIKSDSNLPADVKLLINNLDHSNTDVYYSRTLSNMLNIVGIPIPSTKTSGGDTGEARQLGDGWIMADLRADQDELMFKNSEMSMLELVLKICKTDPNCNINELEPEDIEPQFERNKSDNLLVKLNL